MVTALRIVMTSIMNGLLKKKKKRRDSGAEVKTFGFYSTKKINYFYDGKTHQIKTKR